MDGKTMDYPLTLIPLLERAGKLFGKVELVSRLPDRSLHRYTYADFHRRARALAECLSKAGLRRGDRVATLMWNHYAHLEACFGIAVAGGVFHPLNFRLHADELAYTMNHAQDRFLIVDDALLSRFEEFRSRVKVERVLVVSLSGKPVARGYEEYEEFLQGAAGGFTYPDLDENEAASLCYTSGTTGRPKGAVYTHRALAFRCLALGLAEGPAIAQRDVVLSLVPFFHLTGWALPLVATMAGSKQVFPGPHYDAESLLELLEQERATFTAGVPTLWLGVQEALEKNPGRWKLQPGLRIIVGGAAPSEAMFCAFDRQRIQLLHGWAMTETYPGVFNTPKSTLADWPEEARQQLRTSQGLPAPFVELRVVNEDGEAPWDGKTMGELQIRSPGTAASYYHLPEERDKWTADGWFRTGDIVTIDPEGYVKITDRSKDLIKSGGEWISSVDLENALMGHPGVKEAAVIAVPHPKWQERPLAVVVPSGNPSPEPEALREFLAARFARWQLPDAFVFVPEIPRTSTGKVMKTKLRQDFAAWEWEA